MIVDPEQQLASDLEPFVDRGTFRVGQGRATWERDGVKREIILLAGPDAFPVIKADGRRYSYREYLASPGLARLERLATLMTRPREGERARTYVPTRGRFIPDSAVDGIGEASVEDDSVQIIWRQSSAERPIGSTLLIFVSGEAGSGKTMALRRLCMDQASRYLEGTADFLYLYVNAQGRALATLDDVIARELDDLQATWLAYGAVTVLTRHRLVVPIIDGFDELLGAGGYGDAFASLAALLVSLERRGVVISSARSTFFDYRSFREQAERYRTDESAGGLRYDLDTVEVLPWDRERIEQFFTERGDEAGSRGAELREVAQGLLKAEASADGALLGKPFYAAEVAKLYLEHGVVLEGKGALLDELVGAFLRREAGKYTERGREILSLDGHRRFLQMLAEEMWWLESRDLEVGTVQAIAQLLAEELKLPAAVGSSLVEKVSSYAFLTSRGGTRKRLAFQHEVFYGYFLAEHLHGLLEKGGPDLKRFLARSVVEDSLATEVARRTSSGKDARKRLIENAGKAVGRLLADQQARENGGELAVYLLRNADSPTEKLLLENLVFRGSEFRNVRLVEPVFRGCELDSVVLTSAQLTRPRFEYSLLRELRIDPSSTRLDGAEIVVGETLLGGLWTWVTHGEKRRLERIDSPVEVARVLRAVGARTPGIEEDGVPRYPGRVKARVDLLFSLLRILERQYHITDEELRKRAAFRGREWDDLRKLLYRVGVLEDHSIQKSGPPVPLMRLVYPPEIVRRGEMVGASDVPDEVRALWRDIQNP